MEDGIVNPGNTGDLGNTGNPGNEGGGTSTDGGNKETSAAWKAQLKGDLKDNEFFNQFGSVTDVGKYALDAQGKLKDAIIIGEGASEDEIAKVFAKLGKPEKPEEYKIGKPENWPENVPYDVKSDQEFQKVAHSLHLTGKQAEGLHNWYHELLGRAIKEQVEGNKAAAEKKETDRVNAINALKVKWGDEGWKANIALASRAIDTYGGEGFRDYLEETGLGNDPRMINTFVSIGKAVGEDVLVTGDASGITKERLKGREGRLTYPSMNKK